MLYDKYLTCIKNLFKINRIHALSCFIKFHFLVIIFYFLIFITYLSYGPILLNFIKIIIQQSYHKYLVHFIQCRFWMRIVFLMLLWYVSLLCYSLPSERHFLLCPVQIYIWYLSRFYFSQIKILLYLLCCVHSPKLKYTFVFALTLLKCKHVKLTSQ